MADSASTEVSAAPKPMTRDAADIEADLRHLADLQDRLDGLRIALPAIYAPMNGRHSNYSNGERFHMMRNAAVQGTADIAAFREEWTSDQTQIIFARAAESLEKEGDLSKARNVPLYSWNK